MTVERVWRIIQSTCVLIVFNVIYPFACIYYMLKQDLPPSFLAYVSDVREIWADYIIAVERDDGHNDSD